jgi:predicted nucleotidyltransferase component of viral defense system
MLNLLSKFQQEVLKEVSNSEFGNLFVWSGGTALSYYYLQHRDSFDLDFMSQDLFPDDFMISEIKKIAEKLDVKKIEEQKSYNRFIFWITKNDTLKLEFVFYPFPHIKKPKIIKGFNIKIDSIEDILTNKVHAAFERSEPKDVFDLYCIFKNKEIDFAIVFEWVKKKFGVEIDPVLFSSKVFEGIDRLQEIKPIVFKKELYNPDKIKLYFQKEAEKYLKKNVK